MELNYRQKEIIEIVSCNPRISISKIQDLISTKISIQTLNRDLALLVSCNILVKIGKSRSTSYIISDNYKLFEPLDLNKYFETDIDQRNALETFNFNLLDIMGNVDLFTLDEKTFIDELKKKYNENISTYPKTLYQKELERLTIELSWKSSQIEGNTYSLLETEMLFLEKEEAIGKPHSDAIMLLNHKDALGFILENRKHLKQLSVKLIEEIHYIIIKDLGVSKNIRSRTVGITGTNYKPIDNQYQIKEAMESMCKLINMKSNIFEKAFLAIILISYIQPFEDGNKRTARMISNLILITNGFLPLSYRSVSSIEYKKAILLFYEQCNLSAFKDIFIDQIKFSVKNYFV